VVRPGFCGRRDRGKRDERTPDAQEAEQFTAVHVIQLTRQVRLGHDTACEGRCYVEGVRDHLRFGFQQGVQFICCDLQDPAELRADERVGVRFPPFPLAHRGAVDAELVGKDFLAVAEGFPSVLDSACGYAAFSVVLAEAAVLTAACTINLLAPAAGRRFVMTGEVVRAERRW